MIAQYFPPRRSTFSSRWTWLTVKLAERGHAVDVVALMSASRQIGNLKHALESDPPGEGITIRPVLPVMEGEGVAKRAIGDIVTSAKSFTTALRAPTPDVVVASAPTAVTIPLGWVIAKLKRRPFVLDLRDAWPELMDDWREWDDDGSNRPRKRVLLRDLVIRCGVTVGRPLLSAMRANADRVVVTTEALGRYLRETGLKNVEVVRNTSIKPWTYALTQPELARDELRVLYLGNVGRAQLLATAVRAAGIAQARGVNLKLRIVGSGVHWTAVQEVAKETGATVEFLDRVPTYEVLPHYEWADSVIVGLRAWDAMKMTVPSKLYEILLTGRHITAIINGESAGLVEDLKAGHVVPPENPEALADLWEKLANDRTLLHVPHEGRRWVTEELSADKLSESFEAVLKDVAGA